MFEIIMLIRDTKEQCLRCSRVIPPNCSSALCPLPEPASQAKASLPSTAACHVGYVAFSRLEI